MKTFAYRGFTRDGKRARGMIEALDPKDAREKLSTRGILPEFVEPARGSRVGRARITLLQRAEFYRELGALAKAGVPVVGALDLLLEAQPDGRGAHAMATLRDLIREGASTADALPAAMPDVSAFELALIQTSQRTGRLGEILEQMAEYLDEEHRIREGIQSALVYPLLVVGLALVIGVVMILAVLPRLGSLFADTGMEFPALTRMLIWLGGDGRWIALSLLILPPALAWIARRRFVEPTTRVAMERSMLRVPILGAGIRLTATIRFSRTLALLLRGGVPLVESLPLAGRASGNSGLDDAVRAGTEQVRQGLPVATMLSACPLIGHQLPAWVRAGEAAGDLPGMLEQAARRFQAQWETLLQRAVRLAEPILIILVGGFVLLVALAILMPMLALNRAAF